MKFTIIGIFLSLLFNFEAIAQNQNYYQSTANPHYWKYRKPYDGYWQQDVHYKIKASISANVIQASEELVYTNNSPFTLHEVYFHLYQNAFIKGSYLEELHKVNHQSVTHRGKYQEQGLGTTVSSILIDGKPVSSTLDNTILKLTLNKPMRTGESIKITMNFNTYFDIGQLRRRMGIYKSWGWWHYNGVHWYPRIAVYDMKKGWDTDQHLNKELYGDYGLFDVELTFPNNYIVEATGTLTNEEEVLPQSLKEKLNIKNFANKPWNESPSTIVEYDSSKRKTWHYIARNVHDFAFTADPHYRIDEKTWNGIKCIGLVKEPHASKWQNSADYVSKIIKTFSEDFGMYEYPKMIAADADDGMEYPMLTLDGGADPDYRGLLVHEIGHNWFYGMIGNNETYRAALDEGFTQFLTAWGLQKIDGDTMIETLPKNKLHRKYKTKNLVMDRTVYNRYMYDAIRNDDKALNTHSNDFHSAIGHENGYSNVYHKTATMLYNLQYVLGDSVFQQAMKHYVAKWKFCHPYFEDFRQAIIEYTQSDLNWFFDQWLETTKHTDYSISKIKASSFQKNQYDITFKRIGDMQMPIDFSITDKKGNVTNYYIPNTIYRKKTTSKTLPMWYGWDLMYPEYTAKVIIPNGIKTVQIDPSNRLADVDMINNYKTPGMRLSPASKNLYLERFISRYPSWKKYDLYWRPDLWWNAVDGLKVGLHLEGSQYNYLRKLNASVWFNTRQLTLSDYQTLEGESFWKNTSPFNYAVQYETPLKKWTHKLHAGIDARYIDGFAKKSLYSYYELTEHAQFQLALTTQFRKKSSAKDYLLLPNEWTSYVDAGNLTTKENTYLQFQFSQRLNSILGQSKIKLSMRAPLSYQYAFIEGECLQAKRWKKFDIKARVFARYGFGKDAPTESLLYMSGANPEDMMDNKWIRSQGIAPRSLSGMHTDQFAHIHQGGGLNLRGYNGYYAVDEDKDGLLYINYKGMSGASLNTEIDFDNYIKIRPKYIRDYIHFDTYVFADAGFMSRAALSPNAPYTFTPSTGWSKVRMDAGLGVAMTIKKFGPLDKLKPFTIRFDMPLFLSSPPYAKPEFLDWRWIIGIGRSF
ncbi:MAG: M1 family metallopeptidase [Chitinophagaceae bacterium]